MKESNRSGGSWRRLRLAGLALAVSAWCCGGFLEASPAGMIQDEGPGLVLMPEVDLGPVGLEPFSDEVPPMPDSPPHWVSATPVAESDASTPDDLNSEASWPDFNEPTSVPTPTENLTPSIDESPVESDSPPMVPEPDEDAGTGPGLSDQGPIVRVYHLNYVRPAELFEVIKPFLSPEGTIALARPGEGPMTGKPLEGDETAPHSGDINLVAAEANLDSEGTAEAMGGAFPAIRNTIILRDDPESVHVIDEIVAQLDVQPKQVLLDAVVVGVELQEGQELGVNFAVIDTMASKGVGAAGDSEIQLTGGLRTSPIVPTAHAPGSPNLFGGGVGDRPSHVMPAFLVDQGLKYGFVSTSGAGFLRALETQNKVKVLAHPSLLVSHRQSTDIPLGGGRRAGHAIPEEDRVTASGQAHHALTGGHSLAIRPHVTQDGMIRLEVCPDQGSEVLDSQGDPDRATSTPITTIMVPDGATLVIGGMFDRIDENQDDGGRGLARLRSLNPISRNRAKQAGKQELLVVLTPRILSREGSRGTGSGMQPIHTLAAAGADPEPSVIAPTLLDPVLLKKKTTEANLVPVSGLRDLIASDFEANDPSTFLPTPIDYGVAEVNSGAGANSGTIEADDRGYRPGDLTRAVIARIAERRDRFENPGPLAVERSSPGSRFRFSGPPIARAAEPAPATTPSRDPSVLPVGMVQHVVEPGEDFRSIAGRYYGSPMLHAALWSVNRHSAPAPDGLQPGMTLMLPPAEVLERVYVEAVEATVRAQSPADSPVLIQPEPSRRRGLGLFRRD